MAARNLAIAVQSINRNINNTNKLIRMFFYHHIFDDEKLGFERQLKYIKNFGEFISIDDLASMVQGNEPIDGRYFCLSFDDG